MRLCPLPSHCSCLWVFGLVAATWGPGSSHAAPLTPGLVGRQFSTIARDPDVSELKSLLELFPDDAELQQALKQFALAKLTSYEGAVQDRTFELRATNWAGRLIFLVVHVIIAVGTWFAIAEFRAAQRIRETAKTDPPNEVTVSLEGIAIKSTLQGMALLTIAFGFYLVYLKYVHPVVVITSDVGSPPLG